MYVLLIALEFNFFYQVRPLTTKFSQHFSIIFASNKNNNVTNYLFFCVCRCTFVDREKSCILRVSIVVWSRLKLGLYPAIVPIFLSNSNCLFWRSMQCSSALCLGNMLSCYLCLSHSLLTTFNLFWDENVFAKI